MLSTPTLSTIPKLLATCDSCKARRVKCTSDSTEGQCHNCIKRHEQCHYSLVKTRRRRRPKLENNSINEIISRTPASRDAPSEATKWNSPRLATPAQTHSSRTDSTYRRNSNVSSDHNRDQDEALAEARNSPTLSHVGDFPKTYVDHVLAHHYIPNEVRSEELGFRVYGYFGASSSMAYFSEKRIRSLSLRLGNDRLNKLLETMATIIETRLKPMDQLSSPILASGSSASPFVLGTSEALYINSYFDHVHPVYPFLDPVDFQRRAASSHSHEFAADKSWSALYHAVLSLGCQFNDGGTFEPGKGTAWKYFQVSLSLCGDLILSKGSLMTVQALTAMAVFSLNISCTQLETSLVSEAAKVAQVLGLNKTRGLNDATSIRTFWVLYCLEKSTTFLYGKGSVIMDSDIGCPFLSAPEAVIDGVDWLLAFCRYARILSQAYERLFTASATINSAKSYWIIIDRIREDLETWRASIAAPFQPDGILRGRDLSSPAAVAIAIRLHFYYYNVLLALDRLTLHLCAEEPSCVKRQLSAKKSMMKSARSILELTKFIDVEPYTPTWILALMPLSALFILFDLVIHNPKHPETKNNIALLDVASGHFSRLEYASNGSIPGSLIAEFAHLARQNISDIQVRGLDLSAKTSTTLVEPACSNFTSTESSHDLELSDINNIQYGLETTMPLTNDALFFPIYDDFNDLGRSTMGVDIMDLFDSNIPQFPSYFHA